MALAKRRDRRMLAEVQNIQGADHSFLLGFYYRMTGNYDKALERLDESLKLRKNFSKAKREKVQVLINLELFEEALSVAKENYENDKTNPYHIHAYFLCLIKSGIEDERKAIIDELLSSLEKSTSDFGKELYLRSKALKVVYEEHDLELALALIDKAIENSLNPIYALQDKFDICERAKAHNEMEKVISELQELNMRDVYGKERAEYRMKVLYAAYTKNTEEVQRLIKEIEERNIRVNIEMLKRKTESILIG